MALGEDTDSIAPGNVLVWRPSKRSGGNTPLPSQPTSPLGYGHRGTWRSDAPIAFDWWQCARQSRGYTEEQAADALGGDVAHIAAIEAGSEQPTLNEVHAYARWTDYPLPFFWQEPSTFFADPTAFNSLDYHASLTTYVCDPCERATGEEVDADYRCVDCKEDLCVGCTHLYPRAGVDVPLCARCWRKMTAQKAAKTRRERKEAAQV